MAIERFNPSLTNVDPIEAQVVAEQAQSQDLYNNDVPEAISDSQSGGLRKALRAGKTTLESAVMALEITPFINEGLRYGPAAAVLASTKDPYLAAAVMGATTIGLEGGAAVASADMLTEHADSKPIQKIRSLLNHEKIRKLIYTENGRLPRPVEAILGLYAGSSVLMMAKETEVGSDKYSRIDRLRYGLKASSLITAACTAEALLISEGIEYHTDPAVTLPVAATIAGGFAVYRNAKSKISKETASKPRYNLSEGEIENLGSNLAKEVDEITHKDGLYAVWLDPDSPYSNVIRTREAGHFPEVRELSDEDEKHTVFLAMVDTRKELGTKQGFRHRVFNKYSGRVVHGTTISLFEEADDKTGFFTIDDLINTGNFTAEEFKQYYSQRGIDITHSLSVDTNLRVVEHPTDFDGMKPSDLAYLTLFQRIIRQTPEGSTTAIFASINRKSAISFARLGLKTEPLMGRRDLTTPESLRATAEDDKKKEKFRPVVITSNDDSRQLFSSMNYVVPEIDLT